MTPTLTVCARLNGLPIAITQSPGSIWLESPNFASGSGRFGFSTSCRSALSVSGSRPTIFASYSSLSSKNTTAIFDAPSTTWLFVMMKPSLLMMKPEPAACVMRGCCRRGACCPRGFCPPAPGPKNRSSRSSPPKNSLRSCVRCRDSVRMLTTIGDCALAMFRKVVASTGPLSGALLVDGIARVCADEVGDRSSREAMTMPTTSDAMAMRTT